MKSFSDNETNSGLEIIAKSSVLVFIGVILSKLFTYFYRIVIARQFGPEVYGIFSLSLIAIGFLTSVSSFGVAEGLLRFIPFYRGKKQENKIRYLIRKSTIFLVVSSLITTIILFLLSDFIAINIFHAAKLSIFLKILSISAPIYMLSNVFLSTIRAYEQVGWYSFIYNVVQNVMKLVTLLILIFIGVGENSIPFSYILGILSMLILSFIVCRCTLPNVFLKYTLKKEEKLDIIREIFSYSWPIIFLNLITNIYYWTDSAIIGYFMNPENVGLYNSAIPIIGILSIIPLMFTQLFFPLITRYFSQKKTIVIKEITKQVVKWILILTLPLFAIIFAFPGTIINILFGKEYIAAQNALRILSIGGFFSSFTFLFSDLLYIIGKSKVILINLICTSIINIILNIVLVKNYGIEGASIATTITWTILCITLLIEIKHYLSFIPLRKKMITILLISIIPLFLLLILKQFIIINILGLIILGIFYCLVYILLIFLLKGLDITDFSILKMMFKKIKFPKKI